MYANGTGEHECEVFLIRETKATELRINFSIAEVRQSLCYSQNQRVVGKLAMYIPDGLPRILQ